MIKSLVSQGPYLVINGGYHNYPYMSPGAVGAGQLRWNTNMNEMEVNDGVSWRSLGAINTTIALSNDAQDALSWALKKMQEEKRLEELCQEHVGIKDLKEKLEVMIKLVQDHASKP